jgi:phage terminase large subunit-like protein
VIGADGVPRSVGQAVEASARSALETVRLTNAQRAFASYRARRVLWRGPNTVGKSLGLAYDMVHALRGTHPLRPVDRPPVRLLIVSESWTQMDPLCEKIDLFLPKDEIDERVRYEPGSGFLGFKSPHIPLVAGPGKGSVLHFATYKQGSKRIAGGQFHGIGADEPMPEKVFGELQPRMSRFLAWMRVTFTPTPETSLDLVYFRQKIEQAKRYFAKHGRYHPAHWQELHTELSLDGVTPRGGLVEVPWKTQDELDELVESYLEIERGMRTKGDWEPIAVDRLLTAYGPRNRVEDEGLPPGVVWYLCVGIDHGAGAGRQAAVLVACSEDGSEVRFLDEAISDGRTSTREDAIAIRDMLARHDLQWHQVDHWVGDRAHSGDRYGNAKSNSDLMKAFADLFETPEFRLRGKGLDLVTPHKERASEYRGLRIMNSLFKEMQALVHARCVKLIEGIVGYAGAKDDPLKDRVDAARYAVERLVDERRLRPRLPSSAPIGM